jgi:hypothetical protein
MKGGTTGEEARLSEHNTHKHTAVNEHSVMTVDRPLSRRLLSHAPSALRGWTRPFPLRPEFDCAAPPAAGRLSRVCVQQVLLCTLHLSTACVVCPLCSCQARRRRRVADATGVNL